ACPHASRSSRHLRRFVGLQPLFSSHCYQLIRIDKGHDTQVEGMAYLQVFPLASRSAVFGQSRKGAGPRAWRQKSERERVAAVGDAEKIIKALGLRGVHLRKISAGPCVARVEEEFAAAEHGRQRNLLAEFHHDQCRHAIGGIMQATPDRYFQLVEYGNRKLMQQALYRGAEQDHRPLVRIFCALRRDRGNTLELLVAEGNRAARSIWNRLGAALGGANEEWFR